MLSITEAALEHISQLLDGRDDAEGTVVRCTVEEGSLALIPDTEQPGDQVFHHEDKAVFVVAEELSQMLDGREFDVGTTEQGTGLTLRVTGGGSDAAASE